MKHQHEFTGLWWNFGPYGRQDVHVHSCFDRRCSEVVVGQGRDCKASSSHRQESLRLTPKRRSE